MNTPVVPIFGFGAMIAGAAALIWYDSLSTEEKQRANDIALDLYGETMDRLTGAQPATVMARLIF
jgi:hypothetical protein